jgi:cytochrome c553
MEILYMQNGCNNCHGVYGEGVGTMPKLQGLKQSYLIKRLKELQKGVTKTPNGAIMVSFAKALTIKQIEEISKYLSKLKTRQPKERYEPLHCKHVTF